MTEPQDPFEKRPPADGTPPPPPPPPGYGQPPGWGQQQYGGYPPPQRGTNVLAIIALVSVIFCWPVSIVLGFIARSQIKQRGEGGDGIALAAIIVGCVFALITVLVIAGGGLASSNRGY